MHDERLHSEKKKETKVEQGKSQKNNNFWSFYVLCQAIVSIQLCLSEKDKMFSMIVQVVHNFDGKDASMRDIECKKLNRRADSGKQPEREHSHALNKT